jgi:hypothetical protein
VLPVSLVAVASAFFFAANQSSFASNGLPPSSPGGTQSGPGILFLITTNLLNVPALWADAFGSGPLGWLDTVMPAVVWVVGIGIFCAVTFAGLRAAPVRKTLVLVGLAAALWLIPTYILVKSNTTVGFQVQSRYLLPLVVVMGGIALLQLHGRRLELDRTQAALVVGALSITNAVALHATIRRYVSGSDVTSWNLNAHSEWWWSMPLSAMAVWILGSLAFAIVLVESSALLGAKDVRPEHVTVTATVTER